MDDFLTKENCDRCKSKLTTRTMSWLNEDVICIECSEKESSHNKYEEAKKAELAEVKKGNYNYEGLLHEKHNHYTPYK